MSQQSNEFRPLAEVIAEFKLSIENGTLTLEQIANAKYLNNESVKCVGFKEQEIEQLAMHALENNKMPLFDLIAQNQFQTMAEKLQIAKLKKEIKNSNSPDLKQEFSCKVIEEQTEEKTGYLSGSQDSAGTHVRTELVDSSFCISDLNKVVLVNHALQNNKSDVAKQLVVQLSNEDLKKFSKSAGLEETVSEEISKRQVEEQKKQFLNKLNVLEKEIKISKTGYESREKSTFDWFRGDTVKDKKDECVLMLKEITRLKDLLTGAQNGNTAWTLDDKKAALKDKKTLHGHALTLNIIKGSVEQFMKPAAPSAAPALSK